MKLFQLGMCLKIGRRICASSMPDLDRAGDIGADVVSDSVSGPVEENEPSMDKEQEESEAEFESESGGAR